VRKKRTEDVQLGLAPESGEDRRKAAAETTAESGRRRTPLSVDGREPVLLEKGFTRIVSAEKAAEPAEKCRLDQELPERRRWWEMPFLTFPLMEGVGGEDRERRTNQGLELGLHHIETTMYTS
jgi:hypothetical protein